MLKIRSKPTPHEQTLATAERPPLTKQKSANPLLCFIDQINHPSTKAPQAVIDHINRMFKRVPREARSSLKFDYDMAFSHYKKLSCRLNLMRSQYELMLLTPSDRGYLLASKATALWMTIDAKFKEHRVKALKQQPRKTVRGTSPLGSLFPERHDTEG